VSECLKVRPMLTLLFSPVVSTLHGSMRYGFAIRCERAWGPHRPVGTPGGRTGSRGPFASNMVSSAQFTFEHQRPLWKAQPENGPTGQSFESTVGDSEYLPLTYIMDLSTYCGTKRVMKRIPLYGHAMKSTRSRS